MKPLEGGHSNISKKEHLVKVWRQTGSKPPELDKVIPRRPKELLYLWDWLAELSFPLSFTELESWQRATGRRLSRYEVLALIELDKVRSYG